LRANEKAGSKTDDEVIAREEEEIRSDGFSTKEIKQIREKAQTLQFQAEVNKLMGIIINSLYSSKEVFLREVISNASDALDKIRHISLGDRSQLDSGSKLEIRIKADRQARTLTITDSGVGMTKEELINNLGTIAKSGTTEFLKTLKDTQDSNLIGQFGVGFYSVYLVADNVTVITKSNNDAQYVWQSDAHSTFTISEDPRGDTLKRGTSIVLHIKEGEEEFLEQEKLATLVKKYSEFINFPIYLWTEKEQDVEVPLTEEELAVKRKERDEAAEEAEADEEQPDIETTKTVKEKVPQWEIMNETKPIWTKSPKEVTQEEYNAFFKVLAKDLGDKDPLAHVHFNAEGDVEFKSLLYIPAEVPSQQQQESLVQAMGRNIKLYVKRVFITDDFRDILPKYMSFIRGIVDADDLPLNVSREMLQEHRNLAIIKNKVIRRCLALFQDLADNDKEKYEKFYEVYHQNIKLGIVEDAKNRARLSKLLMFTSSKSNGKMIHLDEYMERMKSDQKEIYYLSGDSLDTIKASPLLERITKKGYEVLYMDKPIDEYAVSSIEKYDGKFQLRNVAKGNLDLGDDKEETKRLDEEFTPLTKWIKEQLSDKLEAVRVSVRLVEAPAALVSSLFGWSPQMEKIIRAQALADPVSKHFAPKKVLEINPRHPLIHELSRRVAEDSNDQGAKDLIEVLYQTSAMSSGFNLEDPVGFANQIVKLMNQNLNLDPNAKATVEDFPVEEESSDEPQTKDEL